MLIRLILQALIYLFAVDLFMSWCKNEDMQNKKNIHKDKVVTMDVLEEFFHDVIAPYFDTVHKEIDERFDQVDKRFDEQDREIEIMQRKLGRNRIEHDELMQTDNDHEKRLKKIEKAVATS